MFVLWFTLGAAAWLFLGYLGPAMTASYFLKRWGAPYDGRLEKLFDFVVCLAGPLTIIASMLFLEIALGRWVTKPLWSWPWHHVRKAS